MVLEWLEGFTVVRRLALCLLGFVSVKFISLVYGCRRLENESAIIKVQSKLRINV